MKRTIHLLLFTGLLLCSHRLHSQSPRFNHVVDEKQNNFGYINAITQDQQGYIWFTSIIKGLQRYDGKRIISFSQNVDNPNSLADNRTVSLCSDSSGNIWVGTFGSGLDRFDPVTNSFTHFRHDPKKPSSLSADTVIYLATDHLGNVWVATTGGLDQFDSKTNKFIHHFFDENFKNREFYGYINVIYEDRHGMIWVGWGNAQPGSKKIGGGLSRYDPGARKFTNYIIDPAEPLSMRNMVTTVNEDSKGNFWVGTRGDGLHTLDRLTGKFTHYKYDARYPEKLGRPPLLADSFYNEVTFVTEDNKGRLWIGSATSGINCYDPVTQRTTHYGLVEGDKSGKYGKDTLAGFGIKGALRAFTSRDDMFWITGSPSNIYTINNNSVTIPFYKVNQYATTFYKEPAGQFLWVGTEKGLLRKNLATKEEKYWVHDPANPNSLANNEIMSIRPDEKGYIWVATHWKGLDRFDPVTGKFTHYRHDDKKPSSLVQDSLHCLFIDKDKKLWIGTHKGISRMDRETGNCVNYRHDPNDSQTLAASSVYSIVQDKKGSIWVSSNPGINRLDITTGKFQRYQKNPELFAMYVDENGKVWAGGPYGLFYFDEKKDDFIRYTNPRFPKGIELVSGITGDNDNNLWVNTINALIQLNERRDELQIYNVSHGIIPSSGGWRDDYRSGDGQLFLGADSGYYAFYPETYRDERIPPLLHLSSFSIGNKAISAATSNLLTGSLSETEKMTLNYNQRTFSFEFIAIDYRTPGEMNYLYKLENYDDEWRDIGTQQKASFYNVPPGKYIFRVKAVNPEGTMAERSMAITITPPWWKTWWAYGLYVLLFAAAGYGIYQYQKQRIIKIERERTQLKELAQAKEIEKAYTELKLTQAQLVQSEKMASLGELTAGIAHEIQNPLNFVNNFSEVNKELLGEMKEELEKGNLAEAKNIAGSIIENEDKILLHGKRADAIVKGMLQHSRSSSGVKEPTDINALADEYLRLAYHGLRARDKTFNALMKTDFDPSAGSINIVPQDIGRVILNLITNAFYAVTEKKKQSTPGYEPMVTVVTRKINDKLQLRVEDNGNGIPPKVLDKIFQPFFTTKPTGQGTGLGLSLSYDIVKAHGGDLKVETTEGQGSTFIITLPQS